jgi:hypothetical protein
LLPASSFRDACADEVLDGTPREGAFEPYTREFSATRLEFVT